MIPEMPRTLEQSDLPAPTPCIPTGYLHKSPCFRMRAKKKNEYRSINSNLLITVAHQNLILYVKK